MSSSRALLVALVLGASAGCIQGSPDGSDGAAVCRAALVEALLALEGDRLATIVREDGGGYVVSVWAGARSAEVPDFSCEVTRDDGADRGLRVVDLSQPRLTASCAPGGRRRPLGTPDGDYYHFIRHDGRLYSADGDEPPVPPVFGRRLGTVTCRFSGSATPLDYSSSRDGEAAFLDAGTPYFEVEGRRPEQAIGAEHEGRRLLFVVLPGE